MCLVALGFSAQVRTRAISKMSRVWLVSRKGATPRNYTTYGLLQTNKRFLFCTPFSHMITPPCAYIHITCTFRHFCKYLHTRTAHACKCADREPAVLSILCFCLTSSYRLSNKLSYCNMSSLSCRPWSTFLTLYTSASNWCVDTIFLAFWCE